MLLALVVAQTWLQERLKIRLRERLTQVLLDLWLKPNRAYQLGFMGEDGAQPDQRMQEDCRLFSELSTELGVGMLQAFLLLVSFIGVLWALSATVSFTLSGREITVPGYMVWVAVGYAGLGSGLTWLVGRPLIRLNTDPLCARGRASLRAGAGQRERRERRPLQRRAGRAAQPRRVRRGGAQGHAAPLRRALRG